MSFVLLNRCVSEQNAEKSVVFYICMAVLCSLGFIHFFRNFLSIKFEQKHPFCSGHFCEVLIRDYDYDLKANIELEFRSKRGYML